MSSTYDWSEYSFFIVCLLFRHKSTAPMPKLAEYRSYIEYETKDGDPARIQCIYERAIKDNCLDASLWREYTDYLVLTLFLESISSRLVPRAIFFCIFLFSPYILFAIRYLFFYIYIAGFLHVWYRLRQIFVLRFAEERYCCISAK